MAKIKFDTSTVENRIEEGELIDNKLVTKHEARPNFYIRENDTVALQSANRPDTIVEEFGWNVQILEE